MVITDRYDHVIDEKARLAIPAQIRNAMNPEIDGTAFYFVAETRYIQLIPEKLFEKLTGHLRAGLSVPPEIAKARRLLFSSAPRVEPDKAGRVVVPERFLWNAKGPRPGAILGREVTLIGVGDRVELWNREDAAAHLRELEADRPAVMAAGEKAFAVELENPPATAR